MYNPEDALGKLPIEKGLITQDEFMQKLSAERAGYQEMLRKMRWRDGGAPPTDRLLALA